MSTSTIILVNPQMGENIGAAARVMLNFGLKDLRIVSPRDGWPNQKAIETSRGAKEVVENARIFTSLKDALFDIDTLYATTARPRDMVKEVVTPRQCVENIYSKKAAIMFGAEKSGLSNEDIVLADAIVSIPVGEEYQSLNLAQAVAIMCYEIFSSANSNQAKEQPENLATKAEIASFLNMLETELDNTHFFKTEGIKPKMLINISNIFTRANLTEQEVRTLWGMVKSLKEYDRVINH